MRAVEHTIDQRQVAPKERNQTAVGGELEIQVYSTQLGHFVGEKYRQTSCGDKAQGRNWAQTRLIVRVVSERKTAQIDGEGVLVEQFNEICRVGKKFVGKPFVDFQFARVARALGDVGRAKGRLRQSPIAIRQSSDRIIGELQSEADGVE